MDKTEQHKAYLEELHSIYVAKNSDYGDAFSDSMDEYGLTSALIRMGDKLSRLKSLNKSTTMRVREESTQGTLLIYNDTMQVRDESLQDTLLDLANYAIMTAMWLKKEDEGE